MNFLAVGLGLLLVAMGAFAVRFQLRIRSFVSPRRWQTVAALGLVVAGIGLTTG